MDRIEPVTRRTNTVPNVERPVGGEPVERRGSGAEDDRKRKKRPSQPPRQDGRPDADGHIDISV